MESWLPAKWSQWRETTETLDSARKKPGPEEESQVGAEAHGLSPSELGSEVADAVADHLVPKLQAALDRSAKELEERLQGRLEDFLAKMELRQAQLGSLAAAQAPGKPAQPGRRPSMPMLRGLLGSSTASDGPQTPRSPKMDSLSLECEKLLRSVDLMEKKIDHTLSSAVGRPDVNIEEQLEGMEKRLGRKVEESCMGLAAPPTDTAFPSNAAKGEEEEKDFNMRALSLVREQCGLPEDGGEGQQRQMERTFVVNVRRLQGLLGLSAAFTWMVHSSLLVGFAVSLLSHLSNDDVNAYGGTLGVDIAFLLCLLVFITIHGVQHSLLRAADTSSALAFGEYVGNDGQPMLNEAIPGIENPNQAVQALAWRTRGALCATAAEYVLRALCILTWVFIATDGAGIEALGRWSPAHLLHLAAINGTATVYLLSHWLFGMLVSRELHFVLPLKSNGQVWDVERDGVPGLLGGLLGPPCLWFGSPAALDDLRVWAALASSRSRRWAISHAAPKLCPVEMGVYALQGRERASRLARSLRGAKLYDGHRQVYVKRCSEREEEEGQRPSVVITGLSDEGSARGSLSDVDLRRELPEALNIHLLLYDSRTTSFWGLSQVGCDPLDWVTLRRWDSDASKMPDSAKVNKEVPVWDPFVYMGTSSACTVFKGTYGGYRTAIHVARGGVGDCHEGDSEVRAEAMALKKMQDHPNIITLLTSGVTPDGRSYMALESYEAVGCLLSQVANQYAWAGSAVPACLTTQLFEGMAGGLAHMHRHDLIHRSLRAEGVIVTMESQAKLLDMGAVAERGAREQLQASHLAPEVCQGGRPQGPAADCWGLGVVLHEVYQGRSDLVNFHFDPPRPRPGMPSSLRSMDLFVQEAMMGLLEPDPERRWTLEVLKDSAWLSQITPASGSLPVPTADYECRQNLRHYLGRAPPPAMCAANVVAEDKGLIGKSLGELEFEEINVQVLLIARRSGNFCRPSPAQKLEVGDCICFGLSPDHDVNNLLRMLGHRLSLAASTEPPVGGFQPAQPQASAGGFRPALPAVLEPAEGDDLADGEHAARRLMPFHPEFDCFCLPRHASGHELHVSTLRDLGIHVVGLLRSGQWLPEWFPHATAPVHHGDLGLVLRAPTRDGLSVATLLDGDLETLMNEKSLEAQLAVHQGMMEVS